jgi:hypothetical protein
LKLLKTDSSYIMQILFFCHSLQQSWKKSQLRCQKQ